MGGSHGKIGEGGGDEWTVQVRVLVRGIGTIRTPIPLVKAFRIVANMKNRKQTSLWRLPDVRCFHKISLRTGASAPRHHNQCSIPDGVPRIFREVIVRAFEDGNC
jgi:hypothetical protein